MWELAHFMPHNEPIFEHFHSTGNNHYPVDSTIQLSNNRPVKYSQSEITGFKSIAYQIISRMWRQQH